jgi:citrate/tricarballylate utilization protein
MEQRRIFTKADLTYLANLCFDCRDCYYACQYAPPHEFGINLPKILSELRAETYVDYAWPKPMAALFRRNGTVVSLATAGGIALVLILTALLQSPGMLFQSHVGAGAFYQIVPQWAMTGVALATTLYAVLAIGVGTVRFWRDTGGGNATGVRALTKAMKDALTLRNLGGGGHGCNDKDESFSQARRLNHHALFYGFFLCLASTTTAAIYDHFLGRAAPYPFLSLPVLLGTAGGVGMTIGSFGLIWLKVVGDPEPTARKLWGGEYALLVQLFLAATTGLLLLALRDTGAMGVLLAVHLGVILSFFVTMPYSKFVHGIYRSAALLRNAHERQAVAAGEYGGH